MKIILPSFAIGIFLAGTLLGQTDVPPREQSRGAQEIPPGFGVPLASEVCPCAVEGASSEERLPIAQHGQTSLARATLGTPAPLSRGGPPQGADLLLQKAADALAAHDWVSARVRYHADAFGYRPVGQGIYLQAGVGEGRKVRWELKTSIGEQIYLWQQVCNGRYLWQLTEFSPEERSLNRVDLRRVRQELEQAKSSSEKPLNFKAGLSIGGLAQVSDNLRRSFHFTRAEEGRLDQLPVWIVAGTWRPEILRPIAKELAEQAAKGEPLDLKLLPQQLPEDVLVYLGQDDLFPYRIDYRRRGAGQGRAGEGSGGETRSVALIEFYEVQLNTPIDARQFEYEPAAGYADTTEMFLKTLGVK